MKSCLILGASGWLGKSTLSYLTMRHPNLKLTLVGSVKKNILFRNVKYDVISFEDFLTIKDNSYDIFLNYAFLTGNTVRDMPSKNFLMNTNSLINGACSFIKQNNINKMLLTSSGAIYNNKTPNETIYGIQKEKQEKELVTACTLMGTQYSVARIFAVIANHYNFSYEYAFTSFVKQALNGSNIKIESKNMVIRSYLFFDYLLDYFLNSNENKIYDAWNVNLDIYELAKVISNIYKTEITLNDNYFLSNEINEYISHDNFFSEKMPLAGDLNAIIKETILFSESEKNKIEINM